MVATSPDPDDPDATIRETENQKDKERIVNERLDPYSGRFFPKEGRTEKLANLIRQEQTVESIVRSRTWGVVQDRCGGSYSTWGEAFEKWKESNGEKK